MPEQPLDQEQRAQALCPKNLFGHSWQRVALGEGRVQQRCRFCQQIREVQLPPSEPERERQTP